MARVQRGAGRPGRRARPARRGGAPRTSRARLPHVRPVGGAEGAALDRAGAGWPKPRTGCASGACPSTTTSATCASSSTSRSPGCSSPSHASNGDDRALHDAVATARAARRTRRRRRADGQRHRDPGAAGARAAGAAATSAARSRRSQRALTLAEPEGYVRVFVDEGEPMRDLLRHASRARHRRARTRGGVLAAFDAPAAPAPPLAAYPSAAGRGPRRR